MAGGASRRVAAASLADDADISSGAAGLGEKAADAPAGGTRISWPNNNLSEGKSIGVVMLTQSSEESSNLLPREMGWDGDSNYGALEWRVRIQISNHGFHAGMS